MFHYLNRIAILVTLVVSSLLQAQTVTLPENLQKIKANFDILSRAEGRHSQEVEAAVSKQIAEVAPGFTADEVLFLMRYIQERLQATHSVERTNIFRAVYVYSVPLKQKLGPIGPILNEVLRESPDHRHIRVRTLIDHINDNVGQHPIIQMPEIYETGNIQNLPAMTIQHLIETFSSHDEHRDAFYRELTRRGEEAIPALKQALVESENYEVKLWAARGFGDILFQLPEKARFAFYHELLTPLIQMLRIETREVQKIWIGQALAAFYEAEPTNPIFTPELLLVVKKSEKSLTSLHSFKLSENYLGSVKKAVGCEGALENPEKI